MPTVADIFVDLIVVPEDYKKSFDKKKEKNVVFMESFHRRQINPINVRVIPRDKIEDEPMYELACGRRRLWASKQLGHKTICCMVVDWTDEQVGFYRSVENVHRVQLNPVQEAKANQVLLAQFELAYGPDRPKAVGGIARAASATRESNGTFSEKKEDDPVYPHFLHQQGTEPCSAGEEDKSEVPTEEPVKSFSTHLSKHTGKSKKASKEDTMIAKSITPQELDVLEQCEVSREDLLSIARIKNATQRARVMFMMTTGMTLTAAIEELKKTPQETAEVEAKVAEANMSDEEWLAFYCKGMRAELQNTVRFDRDALLYRDAKKGLYIFRGKAKDVALKTRAKGWTPLADLFCRTIWIAHPDQWVLCAECRGKNTDRPECGDCKGCGYKLRTTIPKLQK